MLKAKKQIIVQNTYQKDKHRIYLSMSPNLF
jgi:hypothetical protein